MEGRPFVSVKFSPIGRTVAFLMPDLDLDAADAGPIDAPSQPAAPSPDASALAASGWRSLPVPGETVVVRTDTGQALGTVTRAVAALAERKLPAAGAEVVRRATQADVLARMKHEQREREAHRICLLKIRERQLPMKLARVEQLFDGSRLIFYYTAEGRVDFRELVRDLAAHFRIRIEMRQIGVRDEARMVGGYGVCGRPLCCTTWLTSFEPVSIKMAKLQNLSLNPSKLSGMCGRLKCCLRYELPNGKGVKHGGCADEGGGCSNPTGPGCGGCGSGGCGSCRR
jgi:cell fate regulator YaaT (PSP1 superfamily)